VAHEALIREWGALRKWLDEDRDGLRLHRHLTETAQGWERNQRDAGDLYRGVRLVQALEWEKVHASEMSPLEKEYLKACYAEQRRERWGIQLRRAVIITAIMLVPVVLALTGMFNPIIYHPLAMEWVTVPAGEFQMGSDSGSPDERPFHTVYLDTYEIGKYEVTNKQYYQCVKARMCSVPKNGIYTSPEYLDHPVAVVSWYDANTFCRWNKQNGHLPTEAEWEKAARGTDGRTYPWGDAIDETYANYVAGGTTEVGHYPKGVSPYGAYDMAGNVWEWVADWYDHNYYANSPKRNPLGPESGDSRVLRGGSWNLNQSDLRSAIRNWHNPAVADDYIGFRCSRSQ
jgi:formylglycine-generating enzyme required for sulfatase activity